MMTDNDIIKALECCFVNENCTNCPCYENRFSAYDCEVEIVKQAFDLIKRQQAEIERLNSCVKSEDEVRVIAESVIKGGIDIIKTEAIKEFAERLKDIVYEPELFGGRVTDTIIARIDYLIKTSV